MLTSRRGVSLSPFRLRACGDEYCRSGRLMGGVATERARASSTPGNVYAPSVGRSPRLSAITGCADAVVCLSVTRVGPEWGECGRTNRVMDQSGAPGDSESEEAIERARKARARSKDEQERARGSRQRARAEVGRAQAAKRRAQAVTERSQAETERARAAKQRAQAETDRAQAARRRAAATRIRTRIALTIGEREARSDERDRIADEREATAEEREPHANGREQAVDEAPD